MTTLPADLRKSRSRVTPQGPANQDCQSSTHLPRPLDQSKQFHAYFCQDTLDSLWTRRLIDELEGTHGFKCAEYHRDLVVGERVLDLMTMFIFTSDRVVFILSENFLKSNYAMYQLQLAVQYAIDHDTNNIVALHVDECRVPSELLTFQIIDTKPHGWKERFLDYLNKPAPKMPAQICTNGTHVSVTDLCKTNRSVMSEPPTLKATLCIPDYIRHRIRIWHRSQSLDDIHLRKAAVPATGSPASTDTESSDDMDQQEMADVLTSEDTVTIQYSTKQLAKAQATLLHGLNIRLKDQIVYEARETRQPQNQGELRVEEGDVLEMLEDESTYGANLIVYDSPGSGVNPSSKYDVYASQGGHKHKLFVYMSTAEKRNEEAEKKNRTQSWTSFAFTGGPVTVEVHTKVKDFHRCTVRPRSYNYKCQRSGQKTATFHIDKALKMMSVEFDYDTGDGYATDIRDKLFIFADPPEGKTPNPHDHGVLYYGPGVHKLGGTKTIDCKSRIKEIYLAPGSYLHGSLELHCDGVKLHGRGIISAEMFAHKSDAVGWAIIQGHAGNTTVEGITMVDPARFYYRLLNDHNVLRNAKMVAAWTGNTDGVAQGDYGLLEDTFIIADDASVKFHGDHLKIQRLVIWQMQNGGVFLTGYDTERVDDVSVEDCDVIHTDWCDFKGRCMHVSGNDAVIDNSGTKHFHISNIHFKDIRVEGLVQRIVRYAFRDDADGTVSHVTVENLSVDEQPLHDQMHNELSGSKNGRIVDWKFIDLTIGGHCVNNYKTPAADFVIDERTADVTFECRGNHPPLVG